MGVPGDPSAESAYHERTHLGDAREVAVDMHDAELMEKRRLGNE